MVTAKPKTHMTEQRYGYFFWRNRLRHHHRMEGKKIKNELKQLCENVTHKCHILAAAATFSCPIKPSKEILNLNTSFKPNNHFLNTKSWQLKLHQFCMKIHCHYSTNILKLTRNLTVHCELTQNIDPTEWRVKNLFTEPLVLSLVLCHVLFKSIKIKIKKQNVSGPGLFFKEWKGFFRGISSGHSAVNPGSEL